MTDELRKPGTAVLRVDVTKAFEALSIEARFENEGGVTALFGPSGGGKTSIVHMIAGLLRPDRGIITLEGETLYESARSIDVPAYRRRIGYVFQDARLFPHLSVAQNLDYGRRMNGLILDQAEADRVIRLLELGGVLDRRPGKLSGGERQRVALGRALLSRPRLLLLDEPLGSLDEERKADILPYLIRLRDQSAIPMIYVSHSADEVRMLATQVIRIRGGRITARGGVEILSATAPP